MMYGAEPQKHMNGPEGSYSHFDAASNFSLFFFRRHFHGLKSRPSAENLLFRSSGGVRVPVLRLVVRSVVPLCFLTKFRGTSWEMKEKLEIIELVLKQSSQKD